MRTWSARDRSLLRWVLGSFFIALAVPTGILIRQATTQLRWESFHQLRMQAADLALRIDSRIDQLIEDEENRPVADYSFLVASGEPQAHFIQRSVLSNYLARPSMPGLIGYFQIDSSGQFSTPLLPPAGGETAAYGIVGADLKRRIELQSELQRLLLQNGLMPTRRGHLAKPAINARRSGASQHPPSAAGGLQSNVMPRLELFQAFDTLFNPRLSAGDPLAIPQGVLGRVEQLAFSANYEKQTTQIDGIPGGRGNPRQTSRQGGTRREKVVIMSPQMVRFPSYPSVPGGRTNAFHIAMYDAEVQPFMLAQLASGHLLFVRSVYRNRLRELQGIVVDPLKFVDSLVGTAFTRAPLAASTRLTVAHGGHILAEFPPRQGTEDAHEPEQAQPRELLYRTLLSPTPKSLELIFAIEQLPPGPGQGVVAWSGTMLAILLCGGFLLIYRLGLRRIQLSQQQQDFVAAVSHELKTPLTSIRMHGEMLRENWVPEHKKVASYQFICSESERLSRLIGNVLDLARMNRDPRHLALSKIEIGAVSARLRSQITSQFASTGFQIGWESPDDLDSVSVAIDEDAFTQIVINLVDNAVKFSGNASEKRIEIRWDRLHPSSVCFSVRDYGPGVPAGMNQKIFMPFVRGESELTRSTTGAGIGLSLVKKLGQAMNARIEVVNRSPGAEFRVHFPVE